MEWQYLVMFVIKDQQRLESYKCTPYPNKWLIICFLIVAISNEIQWTLTEYKWQHSITIPLQLMMTSSNGNMGFWPFVRGIHRSPVNSPRKNQWRGALIFSLIWPWINGWLNNGDAGGLRRHRAHYDVTVMIWDFGEFISPYRQISPSLEAMEFVLMVVRQFLYPVCSVEI